jgi:putative ABC transport system permease protein
MVTVTRPPSATTETVRTGRHAPPLRFWLRWSVRDLRRRWVQVTAIAIVIALGTGTYAGLTASARWRRLSYDASYQATNAHDISVSLAENTTIDGDALRSAVAATPHPEWFADLTTSLGVSVQVDASTATETILVPGLLVGVEVDRRPAPPIDTLSVAGGRGLQASDAGADVVVMDAGFAAAYDLPPTGTVQLGGGQQVERIGTGKSPRFFLVSAETGSVFGSRGFAILYTSLARAQAEAGTPGKVSEAAVRLAPGVDPEAARAELSQTLTDRLPDAAAKVSLLRTERGYRVLYDDIENDQTFFRVFALLILVGAAFAAFNLTGRIVEAQRREIGVGMSLGVPRRWLGLRPLLLALEVAAIGAAAGVVVGYVVGAAMGSVTESIMPLAGWHRPFQVAPNLQAPALGNSLVLVASAWPVLRAVRVPPIEAIRTGPRTTARGGLAPVVQRLHLPGSTIASLPVRDALRRPRRTILTVLAIGATVATLVGVFGMIDSIYATIDGGEAELLGHSPDRLTVSLQTFAVAGSETLAAIERAPGVGRSSEALRIGGTVARPGVDLGDTNPLADDGTGSSAPDRFDIRLDVVDLQDGIWKPTALAGSLESATPALVLSRKAADDLGVSVGDLVQFRHPQREGLGCRWVTSEVPLGAIHPNPYRFMAYLDVRHAGMMNLTGIVNQVDIEPAPGTDLIALRRAIFALDGVGSVTPISETIGSIRTTMDEFLGILQIVVWAVLLLAVLIAFNSSSISADERAREHATMFAFGLPVRTVLGLAMAESAIIGVLATAAGAVAGTVLTWWLVQRLFADTVPDLQLVTQVDTGTFVVAALLGIVAVSLAPVFLIRGLRRMDVPATLRVVE